MFSAAHWVSLLAVLTALSLSGCGTLFNEKERLVMIESTPPGAQVEIDGKRLGRTPLEVSVPTHTGTTVMVELPSYGPTVCFIDPQVEGVWVALDVFLIVPLIIDAVTGRWNDVPSTCAVSFGKDAHPTPKPTPRPATKPPPTNPKPSPKPPVDKPADKPAKPTGPTTPFPFPK